MSSPSYTSGTALELPVQTRAGAPALLSVVPETSGPAWVTDHRDALRAAVAQHGAVLVRGLGLSDSESVTQVFSTLATELMSDEEAFAQRRRYAPGVYSSAEWPDHQPMCMHHELSYRQQVPALVMFACLTAPTSGGATGLADAAAVLEALPAELVDHCTQQGWQLRRTYGEDIGPQIADAFGTDDPTAVADYCDRHAIEHTWRPDGGLSTRQTRAAVITHPVTGRRCWVNQVAFLSEWTIEPEIREFLVDMYGEDGLPFTTAYGDGQPIGAELIETLNEVYEAHTVSDPWQAGDLMLVDNLAVAHSREPFEGDREVLVGLADPVRLSDLSGTGSAVRR